MLQLQLRQRELKQAALNAKKEGDMDLARDYLRQAKGIQPLIEASKAGLPVDMDSIPLSPLEKIELSISQKDESFTLVSAEDFLEGSNGTDEQIYENLEMQLVKQIMVTNIFAEYYLRIRFDVNKCALNNRIEWYEWCKFLTFNFTVVLVYARPLESIGRCIWI